jgi:hypothetical protein
MTHPNKPTNPKTTISVYKTTRNKLCKLKKVPEEYLDSVIVRLINKNKTIE